MEAAGAQATPERPLAWIALEANRTVHHHELAVRYWPGGGAARKLAHAHAHGAWVERSEEHTSELQSLMRISYAVFCLKKKSIKTAEKEHTTQVTHQSTAI